VDSKRAGWGRVCPSKAVSFVGIKFVFLLLGTPGADANTE